MFIDNLQINSTFFLFMGILKSNSSQNVTFSFEQNKKALEPL